MNVFCGVCFQEQRRKEEQAKQKEDARLQAEAEEREYRENLRKEKKL